MFKIYGSRSDSETQSTYRMGAETPRGARVCFVSNVHSVTFKWSFFWG